ncbi:DUF2946 family protein [Hydrogenophaga sp.]
MFLTRTTRRCATWLAMLAMVMGALAPTVAQAVVASQGGAGWVQVCSASGMVWLQADAIDGDSALGDASESMTDASRHCPWCNLHGATGLPPSPTLTPLLAPVAAVPQVPPSPVSFATFWPAAPPRAPPLV